MRKRQGTKRLAASPGAWARWRGRENPIETGPAMNCTTSVRLSNRWLLAIFVVVVVVTILHYFLFPNCGC